MDTERLVERLKLDKIAKTLVDRTGVKVYKVTRQNRPYLLKCTTREDLFLRETDSMTRLADAYMPVPRIVSAGRLDEESYYFIQEWWDGIPFEQMYAQLKTRREQQQSLFEVGHLLARIQVALMPSELEEAQFWKQALQKSHMAEINWREAKLSQFEKWKNRTRLTEEDRELGVPEAMHTLEELLHHLEQPEQFTLLHNDFGFRNLMYLPHHTHQIGVLDFENASIGDPIHDLVKLTFNDLNPDDEESVHFFLEGYRRHSPYTQRMHLFPLYQALEGFSCMQWVDKQPVIGPEELKFREKGRSLFLNRIQRTDTNVGLEKQ